MKAVCSQCNVPMSFNPGHDCWCSDLPIVLEDPAQTLGLSGERLGVGTIDAGHLTGMVKSAIQLKSGSRCTRSIYRVHLRHEIKTSPKDSCEPKPPVRRGTRLPGKHRRFLRAPGRAKPFNRASLAADIQSAPQTHRQVQGLTFNHDAEDLE